MRKSSIICAYHFHQILPAVIAIHYYREIKKIDPFSPVLIYIPYVNAVEEELIATTFPSFKVIKNIFLVKVSLISFMPIKIGAKVLQKIYGKSDFDAIYFPHDATSDFIPQTFMQAFPNAERICYGDAFGNLIERNYFERFFHKNMKKCHNFFAYLKRKLKPIGCHFLTMQTAVLIIPVDFAGTLKKSTPLLVPSKEYVKNILVRLRKTNFSFNHYIDKLLMETKTPRYLFLLTNFTEAKLMTLANEDLFFQEIIKKHIPVGATLILKPHAGSHFNVVEKLANYCREKGHITYVFPEEFWSMPIEFAEELVKNSQVLSVSYASISLAYFFNIQALSVLNNELIKKYFFVDKQKWMIHHNHIYAVVYEKLQSWNGKDFLYAP